MYGAVAAAAAAFAGLLFVALTVNLPRILPDAAHVALGLAAVLAAVSIRLQGQTIRRLPSGRRARWAVRMLPVNAATAAIIVAAPP